MEQSQMACGQLRQAAMSILPPTYVSSLLGLGDAIVLKPLIKILATQYQNMYYPCRKENWTSATSLFFDIPNLSLVNCNSDHEERYWLEQNPVPILNLRSIIQETPIWYHEWPTAVPVAVMYDRQLYEYFDIPYSRRYQLWTAKFDHDAAQQLYDQLNPNNQPYVLWHNSMSYLPQGASVDFENWRSSVGLPKIKVIDVCPLTDNLLDWRLLIERAEEIHCVSSSFHCLVDSILEKTKANLYYHNLRHNAILQINSAGNNYRWQCVDYNFRV
jgi:hypothetical protein